MTLYSEMGGEDCFMKADTMTQHGCIMTMHQTNKPDYAVHDIT